MKTEFKKRRKIENATSFKVLYVSYLNDTKNVIEYEFQNLKSMRQWIARNDNENTFGILIIKTLALIDDEWEPFTTIGKKTITLSDLKMIIRNLDEDFKPSIE